MNFWLFGRVHPECLGKLILRRIHFAENFGRFCFSTLDGFIVIICSILGGLGWNWRGLKILPGGRGLFGARTLQKMPGEKVLRRIIRKMNMMKLKMRMMKDADDNRRR